MMAEIVILCVLGVIVTEFYVRLKRPKLSAFANSALGVGGMLLSYALTGGAFAVTSYNTALTAILGVPGAVFFHLLNMWG